MAHDSVLHKASEDPFRSLSRVNHTELEDRGYRDPMRVHGHPPRQVTGSEAATTIDIYSEDVNAVGGGNVAFVGTWSAHVFYKSSWILINMIERGAYTGTGKRV
ncbi:hypothetical protein FPV67DRAFT_1448657 [Lyophyllum atratum]|nr:hypothetical protein FPV67DRAFT_1448657 [Lyophyllum atratum]